MLTAGLDFGHLTILKQDSAGLQVVTVLLVWYFNYELTLLQKDRISSERMGGCTGD